MLRLIFYILCSIFLIVVLQNIFIQIFNIKIVKENFSVGYQTNASQSGLNASTTPEKNASATMIHDSDISASSIQKIFDTKPQKYRRQFYLVLYKCHCQTESAYKTKIRQTQ